MKKIWKSIKNTVSYIWQLPQNILGAILCYIYCSDGDIYDWNKATSDVKVNCYSKKMRGGITLGKYIIIGDASYAYHEFGHTIQSKILGPLYLLVIGLPSIIHAALHKHVCKNKDYYHFWTEKWANNLVDKHYKKLKED